MNIFEKIGKFVETVKRDFERGLAPQIAKLNMQIHRPSSGELDAVPSPSDDELNEWLATLNESDRDAIVAMAHQLADADKDGKRFVALVHHLLSKIPTPPVATAIEIAKRKVAPLLGRFEAKPEQNWTEEELADWLDTLDEHMQGLVQKAVQGYKDINGTDLIGFLSRARRTLEESAQQDAPKNQMSLLHAWYIWQEESRLHEQQTYFTRENRKARGW